VRKSVVPERGRVRGPEVPFDRKQVFTLSAAMTNTLLFHFLSQVQRELWYVRLAATSIRSRSEIPRPLLEVVQ
jgi:hypothetical protein